MFSLTIHFGPNALQWQFLFKEEDKARATHRLIVDVVYPNNGAAAITDDFGQSAVISGVHGVLFEDLDLIEQARIERSIANARGEVRARQRAATDPVIRAAQNGPAVMTPNFRQ